MYIYTSHKYHITIYTYIHMHTACVKPLIILHISSSLYMYKNPTYMCIKHMDCS